MGKEIKKLRELRITLELTQTEMAKILDVSYSSISKYESGSRKISLEMANKLLNLAKTINFKLNVKNLIN